MSKIGRNEPCPCGSGKKYKKCCLSKDQPSTISLTRNKIRQIEGEIVPKLLKYSEKKYAEKAILAAWQDFVMGRDIDMFDDANEFKLESSYFPENMTPEFETIFIPWFLFTWEPDDEPYFEDIEGGEVSFPSRTIVSLYLEEEHRNPSPFLKKFIEQSCSQPFSFYLITYVVPGKQLIIKDIFLGREITVEEVMGSQTLNVGAIVFGRVITLANTSVFFGMAPYVIPQNYYKSLVEYREEIKAINGGIASSLLHDYDWDLRDFYLKIREQLLNPQLPELQNTDGEKLILTELFYRLDCSVQDAFEALKSLTLLPDEDLLQDAKYDVEGQLLSLDFPWLVKGNKIHADRENTALGHITLEKNQLKIEVNSENRAEKIKRKITRRLGKKAILEKTVLQSTEKLIKSMKDQTTPVNYEDEELAQLPEIQEMLKEKLQSHWKNWLKMPLPALNNQTPHQAAKTKEGRELLEGLLLDFQSKAKQDPKTAPDLVMLRHELRMD